MTDEEVREKITKLREELGKKLGEAKSVKDLEPLCEEYDFDFKRYCSVHSTCFRPIDTEGADLDKCKVELHTNTLLVSADDIDKIREALKKDAGDCIQPVFELTDSGAKVVGIQQYVTTTREDFSAFYPAGVIKEFILGFIEETYGMQPSCEVLQQFLEGNLTSYQMIDITEVVCEL